MTETPAHPFVVAIDGPSGTGKSTVAKAVASRLGLGYLDTGAMYRAVTWGCLQRGVDLTDGPAVAAVAAELPVQLVCDPSCPAVLVDGADIESELRTSRISGHVSLVATNLAVREVLVRRQQDLVEQLGAAHGGVVAEGRDITTVVAPAAQLRILLVADERSRLQRRARQLHGHIDPAVLDQTRDEVLRRDRDDSSVAEFSTAAPGVVLLDNSELDLEQTVAEVLRLAAAAGRPEKAATR